MKKIKNLGIVGLTALSLSGCDLTLLGPDWVASGERPMDPVPEEYRPAYAEVEACLDSYGLPNRRNYEDARFFEADKITNINEVGLRAREKVYLPGDKITIVSYFKHTPITYKHGMVHQASQMGSILHFDGAFRIICDGGDVTEEQQRWIDERVRIIKEYGEFFD